MIHAIGLNSNILREYLDKIPNVALELAVRIMIALVVLFVGSKLIKLIRKIVKKALTKGNVDVGAVQFLDSFIHISLMTILLFIIASNFGVDATSIIAVIGSAGIAIGLALQGSLSNFAGGVLILILKPFKVGDYIREDTNHNEGVVSEISLFYTKLTTVEGTIIVLPNGTLANTSLTNVTGTYKRKLEIPFSVSYDSNIETVRNLLLTMLAKEDKVMQNEEKNIYVTLLADSGINMSLRCYVKNEDYGAMKCYLPEAVKNTLDEGKIVIPYPQMEIRMCQKM